MIKVSGVWKIFGAEAKAALAAVKNDGLGKAEVLEQYNAVVGVADVNLEINKGEIFCIMGLSGSGKSTLVRHFNRLLEPTAGSIEIEGVDVMGLDPIQLREFRNRKIGMVFQNFALLPHWSVLDNVGLPMDIRRISKHERMRQAAKILDIVELSAWGNKFAHELSGGMQQRVGLARALAADPDVLLMDEPFSALDPLIRRQLQDEFIGLSKIMNKTTVFITHDLDEAVRVGHQIAIMRDGRVVQIGTAEDIVMNPADDYVADFVAGISRLKVVRAHAVMEPITKFKAGGGKINKSNLRINESESLSTIIQKAIDDDAPIVVEEGGNDVGVITRADVLRTVIEGTEVS
ncbi:MAG: betaine/proline/choline family ABC transporter ATP-binding protein [Pseudomonadota bacterium]